MVWVPRSSVLRQQDFSRPCSRYMVKTETENRWCSRQTTGPQQSIESTWQSSTCRQHMMNSTAIVLLLLSAPRSMTSRSLLSHVSQAKDLEELTDMFVISKELSESVASARMGFDDDDGLG